MIRCVKLNCLLLTSENNQIRMFLGRRKKYLNKTQGLRFVLKGKFVFKQSMNISGTEASKCGSWCVITSAYVHGLSKHTRPHGLALSNGQSKVHYAYFTAALFNMAQEFSDRFSIPFSGEVCMPKSNGKN